MSAATGQRIGVIGAGVVGTALARALASLDRRVDAVASRTRASAERLAARTPGCVVLDTPQAVSDRCDLVLLTVPDDAIAGVAAAVHWTPGQAVVHCSGAQALSALDPAAQLGARVGGFHPLQTFADGDQQPSVFHGIAFAVEATAPLRDELEDLARTLGGWPIRLSSADRALYHASAVAVCGFIATLMRAAADLWEGFGGDPPGPLGHADEGLRALIPLARRTIEGIEAQGLPAAMTGPLTRGDVGTVRGHLEALDAAAPGFKHLYCHLALSGLGLARAKGGLEPDRELAIERLLMETLEPVGVP
jgi:predicted short-subunit dehydrogenase-like oxidoreductase (DUF2520 family)